ncbi:spore cortex biosynthesis protein YabQ [Thermanaeromonas toyohensis ToBE]|uniref:Spore cortex biosynthesis protein YabQ n=1 Tax=Thermanaeromonas toyohensis ToBE TaxID=698762 RepID=A0A1W1V8D8_9FIRM|nr:spore cortex biosynthesis protein YabQ [Thermanaeromonas toyohensis]SMB89503.1 spore cortex biosynthesis protein YabQ [Thermanaeromonas toyohensis ToBE]
MNLPYGPWLTFLALAGWGIVLAFLLDCYRICRYYWRPSRLVTQVTDLSLWLFLLVFTFFLLFLINWGEFRAYVLVAWALGALLYSQGSHLVRPWLYRLFRFFPFPHHNTHRRKT